MTQTTTSVGKAQLLHPDRGYDTEDNGVNLHAALTAMWTSVSNHLISRGNWSLSFAANETKVITHNFNTAIANLKILVFVGGVQLSEATIVSTNIVITQNSVNAINVQNNTGSPKVITVLILGLRYNATLTDLDADFTLYPNVTISGSGNLAIGNLYTSILASSTAQALPLATGTNKYILVQNAGVGNITINAQAGETINGASYKTVEQYGSVKLRDYAAGKWLNEFESGSSGGSMPSLVGKQSIPAWTNQFAALHIKHKTTPTVAVNYTHGLSGVGKNMGAVYVPTLNRLYFMPNDVGTVLNWAYIDCKTGVPTSYVHGAALANYAYRGGVYSPTQNRIYLIPCFQSNQANWHYIDCNTGLVVAYAHGATVVQAAYAGGAYSPTQNRIYMAPWQQANQGTWHYIDCNTGNVVGYAASCGIGYQGACYSPTQNRIYFGPSDNQGFQGSWHYIDCNDGTVKTYAHGMSPGNGNAYLSIVFHPTLNRLYFIPYNAQITTWYYIDCNTGSTVSFASGVTGTAQPYRGGVYCPMTNRLYLSPEGRGDDEDWHYIDGTTGLLVSYLHVLTTHVNTLAYGGAYDPINNRIYFSPYDQAGQAVWVYIQINGDNSGIQRHQFGSTILSSSL